MWYMLWCYIYGGGILGCGGCGMWGGVGCNIGAWGVEMLVCGDGKVMRWGVISSNFLIYIYVCVHICYCFALYSLIHTLYGFMGMVNVI